MKPKRFVVFLFVALFIFTFGCAAKVDVDKVRSYSDTITENLLVSMNSGNYSVFSEDFDSAMKNALPEEKFPALISQIEGKIGKYVPNSKQFVKAYKTGKFINVVYNAKFTNETSVEVRIVFSEGGGNRKVSGIWFNSPKLGKK